MSSSRSALHPHEKEAVAREIEELIQLHGNQQTLAKGLKVTQGAISKAKVQREMGLDVARRVERLVGMTVEQLVQKHGTMPRPVVAPMAALDIAVAYLGDAIGPEAVRRVRARAGARELTPAEWGGELMAEQQELLEERATLRTSTSSPGSVLRKRV